MVLYDSLGSGPQVVTVAAGTLGEQAAARLRLRNRGETPAPAALWASRVAGLAGFREPLCSSPPLRCWDLQVSCALFQDPLYPTFRLATTSLFSRRAGRVPACGRGLCELLGARSHPHSTLSFNSWPLCRLCGGRGVSSTLRTILGVQATESWKPPAPDPPISLPPPQVDWQAGRSWES